MPSYVSLRLNGIWKNVSFDTAEIYDESMTATMNIGISRYDMAQLMTNIMNQKGFAASDSEKSAAVSKIADYSAIPSQYQDAVANVYALGIIGGFSDGTFGGAGTMTRGQAAVVIYRMMQKAGSSAGNNTAPVTPTEPETPAASSTEKLLTNGKPVTEENVMEILAQLKAQYPEGTSFANGYSLGNSSVDVRAAVLLYNNDKSHTNNTSTSSGCAGWAAQVSDAIFGQTGFPARRVSIMEARPGDIMIFLDQNGELHHVGILNAQPIVNPNTTYGAVPAGDDYDFYITRELNGTSDAGPDDNDIYHVYWFEGTIAWTEDSRNPGVIFGTNYSYDGGDIHFWTRYPD